MQFIDLISSIDPALTQDRIRVSLAALKSDPLIWEGVLSLDQSPAVINRLQASQKGLTPGTLATAFIELDAPEIAYEKKKLSPASLERVLMSYETYFQEATPKLDFQRAAELATALVEKLKVGQKWTEIIAEILNRLNLKDPAQVVNSWGSVFGILINLIDDQDELLSALFKQKNPLLVLDLIIHSIRCLVADEDAKVSIIADQLDGMKPGFQALTLRKLKPFVDKGSLQKIASQLKQKYLTIDLETQSLTEYWDHLEGSMGFALNLQAISEISAFAGDDEGSRRFNKKSLEVLEAITSIAKIQEAELQEQGQPSITWGETLPAEISRELLYANEEVAPAEDDFIGSALNVIQRAKRMHATGHDDLAEKELHDLFQTLNDAELHRVVFIGPKFGTRWEPLEFVNLLIKLNCKYEALRLVQKLLVNKPTDIALNQIAFDLNTETGDHEAALAHAQLLFDLDPQQPETQRLLSTAYARTEDFRNALKISQKLLSEGDSPRNDDHLHAVEYCLNLGDDAGALSFLQPVLENDPENSHALTLAGQAYKNLHDHEKATSCLEKAIQLTGGEASAWLMLSDLYWQNGNKGSALEKLKEAIAAVPGNEDLEFAYARRLVETGAVAEAYPFLRSLSENSSNEEIDLMLLAVMRRLGSSDLTKTAEVIQARYPKSPRILAELGTTLVNLGRKPEAYAVFKQAKGQYELNEENSIAYLQSLIHWKYRDFDFQPRLSRQELMEAFEILKTQKFNENDEGLVSLIEAETLLSANEWNAAHERFTSLMKNTALNAKEWFIRRNAGLAFSAMKIGDLDLAEAVSREVLDLEPDWVGLQRLAAENFAKAAKVEDCQLLAGKIYESAAENPVIVSWYAELLRELGLGEKAEVVISKAIARNPRNLELVLELAEPRWLSGDREKALKGLEAVKPLLEGSGSAVHLIRAAWGFAQVNDLETAVACLKKAANMGDLDGVLNLAGFYRAKGDYELSQAILMEKQDDDPIVAVLLAELMTTEGNNEKALQLLSDVKSDRFARIHITNFLPPEWMNLVNAQSPVEVLEVSVLSNSGNFADALEHIKASLSVHPENLDLRAAAIECALGAGQSMASDQLMEIEPNLLSDLGAAYYRMIWNERILDSKNIALVKIVPEEDTQEVGCLFDAITNVRLNLLGGDTPSAEKDFQKLIGNWKLTKNWSNIQKISGLRNMLKAALELNLWEDAFWLITSAISMFTGHQSFLILILQVIVKALEFGNRFTNQDLTSHGISDETRIQLTKMLTEVCVRIDTLGILNQEKWILRGKMAVHPDQALIRALATLTPDPQDAAALMSALRRSGQSEIAVKIAGKFRSDVHVLFELALAEPNFEKSIAVVNELLNIDPENPVAYWLLSQKLLSNGEKQESVRAQEAALSFWSSEVGWQTKAADLWADLGNYEKQIDHLKLALEGSPNDEDLHARLGKAMIAVHDLDDGLEHLLTAVRMNPNRGDVWTSIAEAHETAGDLEEALVAAEKAAETDPFSLAPLLLSARVHLSKGNSQQAMDSAQKAISVNPDRTEGYLFLAQLHLAEGDKPAALNALEKASNCHNVTLPTMIRHAKLLRELKGAEASRGLLDEFTRRYPENPELLMYLAEAELECGNLEYAQSVTRRALDLQPENPELHRMFGKIQEKSGNLDQAILSFSKSIAFEPKEVEGYLELSQAYQHQREYSKAKQVLEEGIVRNPKDVRLLLSMAVISKDSKNYGLAEEMLRKAAEIEPKNLEIHRQLGAILALNMIHQSQEASVQS